VTVVQELENPDLKTMSDGMMILDSMTKPAKITRMGPHSFRMILTEGKNRQIRRMCEKLGYEIRALKRIRVMNIELANLPVGKTRQLTKKEIAELFRLLKIQKHS